VLRFVPFIIEIGLLIYTLIDAIQTPKTDVRNLPKVAWILLILLIPWAGPIAWLVAGRPKSGSARVVPWPATRTAGFPEHERSRPIGPDDDPDFLREMNRGNNEQEQLLNRWEEDLRRQRISTMNDPAITGLERGRRLGFPDPQGLFDTYDEAKAAALFKTFVKNTTWHTPTLALLHSHLTDKARARGMVYMQDLSQEQFDSWLARISKLLDRYKKLVSDMHRAGVEFLAGTDTGPGTPALPGISLHDELELLVESGFTPMEALQAATRNPARYLGKLQEMGTIEPGKLADLVLLDANPLDDIRNTRKISLVVLRGQIR